MTTSAYHAVHAARHVNSWGLFAARRYCERIAPHTYHVVSDHGESATMIVGA